MFEFAAPLSFLLMLPLGAAIWCVTRQRRRATIQFGPVHRFGNHRRSWRTIAAWVAPALALLGIALLIAALARPRHVLSTSRRTANVIAIQMAVDISGSMEALDFSKKTPSGIDYRSRLDVVKDTFSEFVDKRPNDLIGLVTFAGYTSTRAPLTQDHDLLKHVLEAVETPQTIVDTQGRIANAEETRTALGDGLAAACARLRDAETASKVVVLLSDGRSNTGIISPDRAIEIATELGITVYTIGIGSRGVAPFRARDVFQREVITQRRVDFDEAQLKKIADATGGTYFNVRSEDGLTQALENIDKLEKTEVELAVYHRYKELFPTVLLVAAVLLLLGFSLNATIGRSLL